MRLWLKMKIISQYRNQVNFAKACGKSDDWVSRLIMGRRNPNKTDRQMILSKLKVHDDQAYYLFQDWDSQTAPKKELD